MVPRSLHHVLALFGIGIPVVFFSFALVTVATGHQAPTPWWTYLAWEAQDAAIYAAVMALNSAAVRRDSLWLTNRIAELVGGLSVS